VLLFARSKRFRYYLLIPSPMIGVSIDIAARTLSAIWSGESGMVLRTGPWTNVAGTYEKCVDCHFIWISWWYQSRSYGDTKSNNHMQEELPVRLDFYLNMPHAMSSYSSAQSFAIRLPLFVKAHTSQVVFCRHSQLFKLELNRCQNLLSAHVLRFRPCTLALTKQTNSVDS